MDTMKLQIETVESMSDYLDKVIKGLDDIMDMFARGENDNARHNCQFLFEGLEWLIDAAELTQEFQGSRGVRINGIAAKDLLQDLVKAETENNSNKIVEIIDLRLKDEIQIWKSKTCELLAG